MASDLHDLRFYSRKHLYSAVHLTVAGYRKRSNKSFSGTGTGFFVDSEHGRGSCYLVTARHVLDPGHASGPGAYYDPDLHVVESVSARGVRTRFRGDDIEFEVAIPLDRMIVHPDPDIDLAVVLLEPDEAMELPVPYRMSELVRPATILADDVGVGTEIVMSGYPKLESGVGYRPLLVPGIVSSDLRYDANYGAQTYPGRGLCHSFSRGGMSGAPVLTTVMETFGWDDDGPRRPEVRILGVNTGHPKEKDRPEALSLFVPATALAALVTERSADLHQGFAMRTARDAGITDTSKLNKALLRRDLLEGEPDGAS